MQKDWTIIKLGGSLFSPKFDVNSTNWLKIPFDFDYVHNFFENLKNLINQNLINRVVISIGGGFLNKMYLNRIIEKTKSINNEYEIDNKIKDNIGISSINLNSYVFVSLLGLYFRKEEYFKEIVFFNQEELIRKIN